jgi:hypothetical protein
MLVTRRICPDFLAVKIRIGGIFVRELLHEFHALRRLLRSGQTAFTTAVRMRET